MTDKWKPTKAQRRVLDELLEDGEFRCVDTYKPALKLVDEGVARITSKSFGSMTIVPAEKAVSI